MLGISFMNIAITYANETLTFLYLDMSRLGSSDTVTSLKLVAEPHIHM